jgi:hypothetical protein
MLGVVLSYAKRERSACRHPALIRDIGFALAAPRFVGDTTLLNDFGMS